MRPATGEPASLVPLPEMPESVRRAWLDRGWPEALLERAAELRVRQADIDRWLQRGKSAIRRIQRDVDQRERLLCGSLRVRDATYDDDEALAHLYANSPEDAGEWEVTVERGPYPFAQFRLQENASIKVLEDRGAILAAIVHSARNTFVGGRRVTVQIESSWRARTEVRGQGLGHLPRMAARRAGSWQAMATYYYRRQRRKPGLRATVYSYPSRSYWGEGEGVRKGRRDDLAECVGLINRTHQGLDLFRPYSVEFLEGRLDDPCWGPKPASWEPVYGWEDFYVLEEAGRVVACAGLWDRGRHVRERWRHKATGEERTVESTALMDFGFAAAREDALAQLLKHLIGLSAGLGRGQLMAPLQFLPEVAGLLASCEPTKESRPVYWQLESAAKPLGLRLTRPYTDLAYW